MGRLSTILGIAAILGGLGVASVIVAQDTLRRSGKRVTPLVNTSPNPRFLPLHRVPTDGRGENVQRQEQRQKMQEQREEMRTKIREHVRERVRAHFARLTRRIQAGINRHLKLANRIEQRLRLLASSGQNVAEADSRLVSARTELANAQTALNDAARAEEQLTASATPREQFQTVKSLVAQAVTHVRNAHRTLLGILGLVRGLHAGEGETPSPSPAVTP